MPDNKTIKAVDLKGIPVSFGLIKVTPPSFNPYDPNQRQCVLIKVKAFSCNFRDLGAIFGALRYGGDHSFYAVGSEFVAEVVATGAGVTDLRVGERVIGNNCYIGEGVSCDGAAGGLPTNQASKEYLVLHRTKVCKVPDAMPDTVAAAFSVGFQTVYSMIRKLNVEKDAHVLVTSARSNTSLFAISALRARKARIYATTSSIGLEGALDEMGVEELIQVDLNPREASGRGDAFEKLRRVSDRIGGFDYVIDPFFDLYLPLALNFMKPGAKYATCGLASTAEELVGSKFNLQMPTMTEVLSRSMVMNYQLISNCLGETFDLEEALRDYEAGKVDVIVDSVYRGDEVGGFFQRTFDAPTRFGKVIYEYVPH
ncbi:MAG TPA: zinc-binding alcohol dehydrogenase family protein [Pyrinomonadaceae bacterium]|nr:zinc-binding alcohol dehydrogenase family protein [Pyrinomonadaceae bacterium]